MNKDYYKNAIEQIQANKELKEKTLEKIKQNKKKKSKVIYIKYLAACATLVLVFSGGLIYFNKNNQSNIENQMPNTKIASKEDGLSRFENINQLKKVLKENYESEVQTKSELQDTMTIDSASATKSESTTQGSSKKESSTQLNADYSTTNVQVENVDEADIVKTDGKYIYYISNEKIYIINADNLEIETAIEIKEKNENFYPSELYVNKNKLIILGNSREYNEEKTKQRETVEEFIYRIDTNYMAKAIVYDISNKKSPKKIRKISLDGNYIESRMIGENVYFISRKSVNYYKGITDDELLPIVKDTAATTETKKIDCTDIIYFKDTQDYSYMIVAGFNINNKDEINTETFFGASDTIYASEKNLYITQSVYKDGYFYEKMENIIYKFNLNNSQIKLQCKGKVEGNLNNQFSMDEYDGNLRIATTSGYNEKSTNQLYILDENLKEIGKIDNLAKGEKIYSVRFIGKVGYIVTFEQIDPLFVIDLSDPTKPVVKGELKIPGYSSYLHPYDETHIIGIGYNTKSNGYGGVTNANMKMSMFDVSDLENPSEMFNIDIGEENVYSQIVNNHKALFYNKEKNLIGFPVTSRVNSARYSTNSFVIYKIDLEKGFEEYGNIEQQGNYSTNRERAIYIGDKLFTLSSEQIILYDLNTLEELKEIELN